MREWTYRFELACRSWLGGSKHSARPPDLECERVIRSHYKLDFGARRVILLGQREVGKRSKIMFVRQMRGNPFEEVAISLLPGEAGVFCGECKVFVANNLRKPAQCLAGIHFTTAIHEQPVVY